MRLTLLDWAFEDHSTDIVQLTDLWANDNQLPSLDDIEAALNHHKGTLTCVYLKGNPCVADTQYKLRMKFLLPKLEQLDDNPL